MLESYLCGGARIVAVKSAVILIVPSHKEGLQTPKKGEEVPVVLPDRRSTIVRLDGAGRECLGLGGEVDLGIDVRGFDRDVAKPRADGVDIDAGPEQVGRGRVPNRVGAHALALKTRHVRCGVPRVPRHEIMHTESRHRTSASVDEDRRRRQPIGDQRVQDRRCVRPQWTPPHFRSLAQESD